MRELLSSIHTFQRSLTMPLTINRIILHERIEMLLNKAMYHCQPHNQRNISYNGMSKVHVGSFAPREGERIRGAIVKHVPFSELYLILMESFTQYFLKKIVQTDFVGEVHHIFITPRKHVCIAMEQVGDCDLSRALKNDIETTYRYIHDVAIILESLQAECDFIHGDLKPDNLRIDQAGYISLIDFGQSCFSYNGTLFFEPVSLVLSPLFCKNTEKYEYDPIKTFTTKHRFSSDILYFLLTMMLYSITDEFEGYKLRISDTYLGNRLVRDFFTFRCKDGTTMNVYQHIEKCHLPFREYVFSKDPEILFQWVPITDPADQERFLEQFTPYRVMNHVNLGSPSRLIAGGVLRLLSIPHE